MIKPPWGPEVDALLEHGRGPYEGILPEGVLGIMGGTLALILGRHPLGITLTARISSSVHVTLPKYKDGKERLFQSYKSMQTLRSMTDDLRARMRKAKVRSFVLPKDSVGALAALLTWAGTGEGVMALTDGLARDFAEDFADSVMAAQFIGLLQALDAEPKLLAQWGDDGRAFGEALPRAREMRRSVLARLEDYPRLVLETYQDCKWDAALFGQKTGLRGVDVHEDCSMAFQALVRAIRGDGVEAKPS